VIIVRRDKEIFAAEGGWFAARWHFSFDRYMDPENMGWGTLRVFNDDRLIPGAVWPLHPHRDVEGITYVVEGTFEHEDNLGTGGVLPAGSVQRMTLGSGAWHSEKNHSKDEPMRFIQLWIMPSVRSLPPSCEQKVFTRAQRTDRLLEVISPDGGAAVGVHQDARVYVSSLSESVAVEHAFRPGFGAYLYVIGGAIRVNDDELATGDAAKIRDERALQIEATMATELIMVEVELGAEA
jgi:redox-sensitive bicupin YhaK (pirin superfamily)